MATRRSRSRDTKPSEASGSGASSVPPPPQQQQQQQLPSWCSGFRKESLDSERAYDERVTTSTKTSEVRLRQESVRYWNRFLEEAQAYAFGKVVGPTCHRILNVLGSDDDDDGDGDNNESDHETVVPKPQDGHCVGTNSGGDCGELGNSTGSDGRAKGVRSQSDDDKDDWEYCRRLFALPSAAAAADTKSTGRADKSNAAPSPLPGNSSTASSKAIPLRLRYPPEVLPVFVITSPLISNCLEDRSKICHSMWRHLNGLEDTIGRSFGLGSHRWDRNPPSHRSRSSNGPASDRTICLYLPRLLSSWTETLQVLWDGLLSHYENTHEAPAMDPEDPRYYADPGDLASRRHSYHVSKRRHHEALVDRRVTTESQRSRIGTKKQQSLTDFILEFLQYVYEEPKEFQRQELHEREQTRTKSNDRNDPSRASRPKRGNLIVLLEDPRILHPKVATAPGKGNSSGSGASSGKPHSSNVVQTQLLETLASWRELHGIPVSLVVFHSVGSKHEVQQNNVLLNPSFESSANGGRFGIRTIRCSVPSSSVWYSPEGRNVPSSLAFGLWSHYFLQATVNSPMPLLAPQRHTDPNNGSNITSTDIVLRMCQDALQNESSCTGWVSSIRSRLASNFFVRKGSFVWDALNPNSAAMMRSPPPSALLSSEDSAAGAENPSTGTHNRSGNNSGDGKNPQPFASGNDDVQIFQPEFVAWFCAYPKAHALLSAPAGERKAGMTLSDKCEALLECCRLLRPPTTEPKRRPEESPTKRRKAVPSEDSFPRACTNGGYLQFWWSISCSLLPLYVVSLTVVSNERLIVSSNATASTHRPTAKGQSKSQGEYLLQGEYNWVLERLADVYKQLWMPSTASNNHQKIENGNPDSEVTRAAVDEGGDETEIKSTESGTASTTAADAKEYGAKKHSDIPALDGCQSRNHDGHTSDFVEATLRRYLQKGKIPGSNDTSRNRNSLFVTDNKAGLEKEHQQSFRRLQTMLGELIVLITTFCKRNDLSSISNKEEDDFARDYKIRLGMTESILEMNCLALGQVEKWTRQWLEVNPLMGAAEAETLCQENHFPYRDVDDNINMVERPVNFRRRILDNLPAGSWKLYQALEGRLSIDREDWYHSFGGTVEDFAIGVWTLQKCGLVRPKKTKYIAPTRGEKGKSKKRQEVISYEKVAVVWC